jgi:hypothetical protein
MFANRKLFVLHERNQAALSIFHRKGHQGDHITPVSLSVLILCRLR